MENLIAQAQNGAEVKCDVNIDEKGNITTEYPVVFARNDKSNLHGYSLKLTKKQAEKIFNRKIPVEIVNVLLRKSSDWLTIKETAENVKNQYQWDAVLKNNDEIELWNASNSGGNTIIGLPGILKDKEKLLLKILDFDWDIEQDKFLLTITAKDLLALMNKAETEEEKEIASVERKKTELMAQARETGQPQITHKYSVECDGSVDSCDIDNIIGYIRADGSRFEERHHCY